MFFLHSKRINQLHLELYNYKYMLELHRNTGKNVEVSHKLSVIGTLIVVSSFIVQCYMLKEKQLAKH